METMKTKFESPNKKHIGLTKRVPPNCFYGAWGVSMGMSLAVLPSKGQERLAGCCSKRSEYLSQNSNTFQPAVALFSSITGS